MRISNSGKLSASSWSRSPSSNICKKKYLFAYYITQFVPLLFCLGTGWIANSPLLLFHSPNALLASTSSPAPTSSPSLYFLSLPDPFLLPLSFLNPLISHFLPRFLLSPLLTSPTVPSACLSFVKRLFSISLPVSP